MKEVVTYVVVKMDAGWDQETRTGVRRAEGFGEEYGLAWGTQVGNTGNRSPGTKSGKVSCVTQEGPDVLELGQPETPQALSCRGRPG